MLFLLWRSDYWKLLFRTLDPSVSVGDGLTWRKKYTDIYTVKQFHNIIHPINYNTVYFSIKTRDKLSPVLKSCTFLFFVVSE